MPTDDQLASRKSVADFVEAMRPVLDMARKARSKLFGRPDTELKEWIRRGSAIEEIKGTEGYQLIAETLDREIEWARDKLELGEESDVRAYLKALRFVKGFILTTERNADISSRVLAGRAGQIPKTMFVKNATVGE